jgi:CRP-like cAMP-binding protein
MTGAREIVQRNPYLGRLPDADRDAFVAALTVGDFPDGHVFIEQGARASGAFLIIEGRVAITRANGAGVEERNRLGPGELFGLVALVDEAPRLATCRAAGPVRVASIPESAFSLLYRAHAPIAYALQRALAAQLARDFRVLDRQIRAALVAR